MAPWPFNFYLTGSEVQVRLGSWVVRRVRIDDIEAIRVASNPGLFFSRDFWVWNEHWCNLWPLGYVILRRRSGWPRTFIINPPASEEFVAELKRRAPHLQ